VQPNVPGIFEGGIGVALREPQRLLLFALTALIHVGLFALLVSSRQTPLELREERHTALVFLRDRSKTERPVEIAPLAPERLPQMLPPGIASPRLIAPPASNEPPAPPGIDWQHEAEEAARKHALDAPAPNEPPKRKPKPEFAWSHSRTHRIEPMENGGFVVWINENCGVAIGIMAMPFCKLGKKPARGDLFEHMDDPATPGDWKDE
jgi:hypothetical protein